MPYRKIHIIGGPGSGKTFSSKRLQEITGLKAYDLDLIFWDQNSKAYIRSSEESRAGKLNKVLAQESWIIEGVYYKWLADSFRNADLIIVLNPSVCIRQWRIFIRFLTRKFIHGHFRRESLSSFMELFCWNQKFDQDNMLRILDSTAAYKDKRVFCKSYDEILASIMRAKPPKQES